MRVLVQRIREGWIEFEDGPPTPRAGTGLLALVGFKTGDEQYLLEPMAAKLLNLRVLDDGSGRMNRSLLDSGACLMLVSQFTLYADCRKGRRPSFSEALAPARAAELYERFEAICRAGAPKVFCGLFGAKMQVNLVNDGPVTIMLDSFELGFAPSPAGGS